MCNVLRAHPSYEMYLTKQHNKTMATVINNPSDNGNGAGMIIGIVIAVALIAVLFIYGLPMLRNKTADTTPSANVNIQLPTGNTGGTQ